MYKTKYITQFKDISEQLYRIEILEDGYTGLTTTLTGSSTPFTVVYKEQENIYEPSRFSTATLKIFTDTYLNDLFTTSYQQLKINLITNNTVVWTGFISPEIYSQDYSSVNFDLEIECISAFASLEYINYSLSGTTISFYNIIKHCITESKGDYNSVYIPQVYTEQLTDMLISNANFYDEDKKPMKLKSVIEELCKFLGWTCTEKDGNIYFLDYNSIASGNTTYNKYNQDLTSSITVNISDVVNLVQLQSEGVDNQLSMQGGYNKVTVIASDYEVDSEYLFPEPDFEDDVKIRYDEYLIKEQDNKNYRYMRNVFKDSTFKPYLYSYDSTNRVFNEVQVLDNYSIANPINLNDYYGCYCTATEAFDDDDKPKQISFDDEFLIRLSSIAETSNTNYLGVSKLDETYKLKNLQPLPVLTTIDSNDIVITQDYVISINFSLAWIKQKNGIRAYVNNITDNTYNDLVEIVGGLETTKNNYYVPVSLQIGDKYYNGSGWTSSLTIFNIPLEISKLSKLTYDFLSPVDDFDYTNGEGLTGYKVVVDTLLQGSVKMIIYTPQRFYIPTIDGGAAYGQGITRTTALIPTHCILKDLELNSGLPYSATRVTKQDTKYENVVNDKYINELDDITFKITSKNDGKLSFSKVYYNGVMLDKLTYLGRSVKPENLMIERIVNQYQTPKLKITQAVSANIEPYKLLNDSYLNKNFVIQGEEIDYQNRIYNYTLISIN